MSQARWEDKSTQARAVAEHGEPLGAAEASVPAVSNATAASSTVPTVLAVRRIGGRGGRFMSNSLADSGGVPRQTTGFAYDARYPSRTRLVPHGLPVLTGE